MTRLVLVLSALVLSPALSGALCAQEPALVVGEKAALDSSVLKEKRELLVYLPDGYANSNARYPVLYLLDGGGHFHHASGLVQFLVRRGVVPPMILVGLENTDRTRDFTPTNIDRFPTSGGADAFLTFLRDELIPFVDGRYRTVDYRILMGHSFGGLVACHALITHPETFDAHVAISPSLWWEDGLLVRNLERFLRGSQRTSNHVFITLGNEPGDMFPNVSAFARLLDERGRPKGVESTFVHMPKENHGTVVHRSMYQGLESIYADWRAPEAMPSGGVSALKQRCEELSRRYKIDYRIPEFLVNQWGYESLQARRFDEAIAIFRYNVEAYPHSANVHDSLGEGYEGRGELKLALASYRKAVERGKATSDRNLAIYREHLEKVEKKLGAPAEVF